MQERCFPKAHRKRVIPIFFVQNLAFLGKPAFWGKAPLPLGCLSASAGLPGHCFFMQGQSPRMHLHRGALRCAARTEGDLEQAQRLLLRAVEAEPDRAYPSSFLGRFLQQQGQLAAAQTAYERALAIEEDALTRYRFGMLGSSKDRPLKRESSLPRPWSATPMR